MEGFDLQIYQKYVQVNSIDSPRLIECRLCSRFALEQASNPKSQSHESLTPIINMQLVFSWKIARFRCKKCGNLLEQGKEMNCYILYAMVSIVDSFTINVSLTVCKKRNNRKLLQVHYTDSHCQSLVIIQLV